MSEKDVFLKSSVNFTCGLLGATGQTLEQAQRERLNEIERRILAIGAQLVERSNNHVTD